MGRAAGIDFGLARIGVALSDEGKRIASPLSTVTTEKSPEKTVLKVVALLESHAVDEVAIGFPYLLSGKAGSMGDEVNRFIELLKNHFTGEIVLVDERLVTVQVERAMREAKMRRKQRSQHVDVLSAVLILQTHLSQRSPLDD
jgi:putative pre-16S rRNA nuclease